MILTQSKRSAALELSGKLLDDIELSQISPADIARRASRLARLLDDTDATQWLKYEISGYPSPLTSEACAAADRSGRRAKKDKDTKGPRWWTTSINQLYATNEASRLQLASAQDAPVSLSSANPSQWMAAPQGNTGERTSLRNSISENEALLSKVIGAIHNYAAEKEIELRFGSVVEDAFTTLRNDVDVRIAQLAPSAAIKISAAFENASSENPEHWANAASACRRLLKDVADVLQPPSEPISGRSMTADKYINRLIHWISTQSDASDTYRDVVSADLEDFGKRIDALDNAGHKGAHAEVDKFEAARFLSGTYLLIGDILRLKPTSAIASSEAKQASTDPLSNK